MIEQCLSSICEKVGVSYISHSFKSNHMKYNKWKIRSIEIVIKTRVKGKLHVSYIFWLYFISANSQNNSARAYLRKMILLYLKQKNKQVKYYAVGVAIWSS